MILLDLFYISIRNLSRRSLRSWLTIIGIVIGIAALVALLSVTEGAKSSVESIISRMGVNKLIITSGRASTLIGSLTSSGNAFTNFEIEGLKRLGGVEEVIPMIRINLPVMYREKVMLTSVAGIPTDVKLENLGYSLYEGRRFLPIDNNKCNVILGYYIAKKTFSTEIAVGDTILINNTKCKVIGILNSTGGLGIENFEVYVPLSTMQNLFGRKDIRFIYVIAGDVSLAKAEISRFLNQTRGGNSYTIIDMGQILQSTMQILDIISFILIAIASISLLVSAVGTMNTMYMAVIERVKEIGILKVLGAKNYEIALIFLFESGLIGLIGGIIGSIFGIILAWAIGIFNPTSISLQAAGSGTRASLISISYLSINPLHIIFAIVLATVVGMLSGLAPAINAARLDPVVALRTE
ncbi:ABC transporter permease [Nanoarchaeota archaeon NZ13-N]|nr:MAG: ABC transporter permease [Nanoarchaeota archaeon NZ13-N]